MSQQRNLIAHARYEVIPMKNLEAQIPHIPADASVSVTCSPVKGLLPTLELTARLQDLGHKAVPHISTRLVEDDVEVKRIAEFCRTLVPNVNDRSKGSLPATTVASSRGVAIDMLASSLEESIGKSDPKDCREEARQHSREDRSHLIVARFCRDRPDPNHRDNGPGQALQAN